jgi:hypothetical protein
MRIAMVAYMPPRLVVTAAALGLLCVTQTVSAQPPPDAEHGDLQPAPAPDSLDYPTRRKSYVYPALEILTMNLSAGLISRALGFEWAKTDFDTMKHNLTSSWKFDNDPYTINNAGHPYGGALVFSAARSTGHNWWVSGLYGFAGSAFWETFMENETPSLNDQITTPIGGMFVGEVMHRASRALLYPGYGKPGLIRRIGAGLIDPIGEVNRNTFGDPWAKTAPPNMYAHFGMGVVSPTMLVPEHGGSAMFHTEVFLEHGLTGDRAFQPRRPLDHFELRGALDAGADDIDGSFNVRGMLVGKGGWSPRIRGMGGLFGAYDFDNTEHVRASMLGVGPGGTAEVQIGRYGYVEGTAAAYLVPWGAAGGVSERERLGRDYNRGPGLGQLLEIKAGKRGVGSLRLTNRAYQIAARFADDDTNQMVLRSTLGAIIHVKTHHAIGLEGSYGWRRETSSDDLMGEDLDTEHAAQVRAFYAITTDEILGR